MFNSEQKDKKYNCLDDKYFKKNNKDNKSLQDEDEVDLSKFANSSKNSNINSDVFSIQQTHI